MADGIRGKHYEDYPAEIAAGILLHREIDSFTDAHPLFRKSTRRLHATYHHYSGVIVDVFYDHFLAANWHKFHQTPLLEFTAEFYASLHRHREWLTPRVKQMLPVMESQNWLYNYRTLEGIGQILAQMDARSRTLSKMRSAPTELRAHYAAFEQEFFEFFEQLKAMCRERLAQMGYAY